MLSLEPEIDAEYNRILAHLPDTSEEVGSYALGIVDVLRAHFLVANHFYLEGHGLGGIGPRDIDLLYSAISRQHVAFAGRIKWTDRFDVSATLFYGLIKNHPFHDANKRTAFLSLLYQLYRMGWCPSVSEKQFEDFTVEVAENRLDRHARFREMAAKREPDADIKFISWYFRKHTRQFDKQNYNITYRELQVILSRYGYLLSNPQGNYIDIIRTEKRRAFLGLLGEREVQTRIAQIGFPRWTAQVGRGALKTVTEATGLTQKRGVDSAAFFRGVDPMQTLITTYHDPLMRLAER
jgi:death-on-curing family protein